MSFLSTLRDRLRWRTTTPGLDERHGRYGLRFARDAADLDRAFALRFEVFNVELGEGLEESFATRRDRDEFDAQCDHLLVTDLERGEVIGTYRMQVAEAADAGRGFYTATEFDLDALPRAVLAHSVELGRACIAREHRNSRILFLLWRGLAAYLMKNRKQWFFGCCSLTSQDPADGARAWAWLEAQGHAHPDFYVPPRPGYECVAHDVAERPEFEIPKLFGTYLRHGAKVCGPPAIDRFFGTIDFLALLDVRAVDPRTLDQLAARSVTGEVQP